MVESGNKINKSVIKIHGQVGATRSREPIKLKISTMMNIGDLEESIFLHESVIQICLLVCFHNFQLVLPSVAHS